MRGFLMAVLVLSGCATAGSSSSLGDVKLRPYTSLAAPPSQFSVQPGRIVSSDLEATIGSDGCVVGTLAGGPVKLCKTSEEQQGIDRTEHWIGSGGELTLQLQGGGKQLRVDGWVTGGNAVHINQRVSLPLGTGPQWDEIRRHPILLALAAAVSGVDGDPPPGFAPG